MNRDFPQDDSPESIEGTAAHWVVTQLLSGGIAREGESAPNGVIVTGEMLDGAELVVQTVERRRLGTITHLEERVSIPSIHADCFGTPDIWAFNPGSMHLEIIDYKFGHGFVDEYFNPQGLLYLLGILHLIEPTLLGDVNNISVSFTIVQPRCYYGGSAVRTHSFQVSEILLHVTKLKAAATAAYEALPTATTNEECKHCPGRHACPALQLAAYSDAEFSNNRQPLDLSPAAAALELRMLERAYSRLGARVEGLREITLANIKAGEQVPHYRVESGRGRQQWTVPPEQVIAIGKLFGKDLSKNAVITPAQALKNNIDEAVISSYSQITPGSLKLIPQSNDSVRRVFSLGE